MSHVTTSAISLTAGDSRTAITPEVQLASNERFQDFLKSYEHAEAPVHAQPVQKTSPTPGNAVKSKADTQEVSKKGQDSEPVKAENTPSSTEKLSTRPVSSEKQVSTSARQAASGSNASGAALQKMSQAASPKSIPPTSTVQNPTRSATTQQAALSKNSGNEILKMDSSHENPEITIGQTENKVVSEVRDLKSPDVLSVSKQGISAEANPSGEGISDNQNGNSVSVQQVETASVDDEKTSLPDQQDVSAVKNEAVGVQDISAEITPPASKQESVSENIDTHESKDAPSAEQTHQASDSTEAEEQVSGGGNDQPLLYQKFGEGRPTTHIEMTVGDHQKVSVEIGETAAKDHRIHIETDNPEVFKSLKESRDTLLASLSQTLIPVTQMQSVATADVQISLATPSFFSMNSGDGEKRNEGQSSQSAGSAHGSVSSGAESSSSSGRQRLRGVVDLTV